MNRVLQKHLHAFGTTPPPPVGERLFDIDPSLPATSTPESAGKKPVICLGISAMHPTLASHASEYNGYYCDSIDLAIAEAELRVRVAEWIREVLASDASDSMKDLAVKQRP